MTEPVKWQGDLWRLDGRTEGCTFIAVARHRRCWLGFTVVSSYVKDCDGGCTTLGAYIAVECVQMETR